MAAALQAMEPDPAVFDPPEISRLSKVPRMAVGLHGGFISSTNKALVVLYDGYYQPGFHTSASSGCYLVYDASGSSLSAIPQIPDPDTFSILGLGAAILSLGEGTYVLAELCTTNSGLPDAALFLWRCPNLNQGQWIRKAVRFPPQVSTPTYSFDIDMAFSYAGSSVCWVDLLTGVLVCNLVESSVTEFTFIPSPEGCSIDYPFERRPRPEEFRSMGCVNGVIKFVTLVGYHEDHRSEDMVLRTWNLLPDLKEWKTGTPLCVGDLWASESFRERDLPQVPPSFPVLGIHDDEVVYVMLNDIDRVDDVNSFGEFVGVNIVCKAQHMLRLDMKQNKVLDCIKATPNDMRQKFPNLLASEFTTYLQGSN